MRQIPEGRRNGECLSSIKHVVGVRSVFLAKRLHAVSQLISHRVAASARKANINLLDDIWMLLSEEQLSGDSVVNVHEEPHPQMTGTLSYRPEETDGRQREKSLDTRHRRLDDRYRVYRGRRLHGGGLFARCPVRCVRLTPAHPEGVLCRYREHRNWRDSEWGQYSLQMRSRFSLSSDSHRILIWRERGSRNHLSNIIERYRYGGLGVLV
ncbi:transposable element Tc1 transposase [Trichonephila clavipes]|nr:transposable element Tc1 transposase [Trichonephila clavipes]